MPLIQLVITLVVVGVILWLLNVFGVFGPHLRDACWRNALEEVKEFPNFYLNKP